MEVRAADGLTLEKIRAAREKLQRAEYDVPPETWMGNDEAIIRALFGADRSLWRRVQYWWWKWKVARAFRRWVKQQED